MEELLNGQPPLHHHFINFTHTPHVIVETHLGDETNQLFPTKQLPYVDIHMPKIPHGNVYCRLELCIWFCNHLAHYMA